jgi:hypothetical protein
MARFVVVPFVASINIGQGADVVAKQLAGLIEHYGNQGWEYQRLESVSTIINNPGCMGCGASSQSAVYYVAIFKAP